MALNTAGQDMQMQDRQMQDRKIEKTVCQRTLKDVAELTGIGLHSGSPVTLRLRPAPADHGVLFHRTDVDRDGAVAAMAPASALRQQLQRLVGREAHGVVALVLPRPQHAERHAGTRGLRLT